MANRLREHEVEIEVCSGRHPPPERGWSTSPMTSPASFTGPARHPGPILPHRSCCSPADRALRRRAHPCMSLARSRRPRRSLPSTPIVQHVPELDD